MKPLQSILNGTITLQFRKWQKPSVKQGTLLKTALGQIEIQQVTIVRERDITERDAVAAGFDSRDTLLQSLHDVEDGDIYKIAVRYHSEDPRIQLRNNTEIGADKYALLVKRLQRLDAASKEGAWTKSTLQTISRHPRVVSTELAAKLGRERMWLKLNIRKLKSMGLTISHDVGYEISPLGKAVLDLL